MKRRKIRIEGFTLVEIMIVVGIIGLLATIAIPQWVRARTRSQTNVCINNLRQISAATQQWALDNRKGPDSPVEPNEIVPYLKSLVVCPAGGTDATLGSSYTLITVADPPICRWVPEDHKLPADTTQ
jgi:prepilin-type N-terminal cleavage/methylation domain-containing protein